MHYSKDPVKHKIAVEKSRKTIELKYGKDGLRKKRSEEQSNWYAKERDRIKNASLLSEDIVSDFLTNKRCLYSGKSGSRKLKKDNLAIYKSLIYHTDQFIEYNNNIIIPFLCRIDIALKKFKLDPTDLCLCGKRLKFDPITQDWTKLYCRQCKKSGTSKSHYKMKYGSEWDIIWNERKLGNTNGFITRGKNETLILDDIEKTKNISINRNFRVLNYYPDGYDLKNNCIYEIYEPHHKSNKYKMKDAIRQKIIQNYLKCKFVIIWEDSLTIEEFEYV